MSRRAYLVLALLGILVSAGLVSRLLASNDWNPTTTIKFGEAFPEQNAYAEDLLGPIVLAPQAGHDGKFFFSQAMDPFYLSPQMHAIYLDRPTYRAQRMLYPTLASLGGLLGPTATAWGLIVVNILGMGVGTALTGRLAVAMGLSPWFGSAFLLNPGLLVALNIDGAEIVALAALLAGVLAAVEDRPRLAAAALSAAALARETMILGAVGLVVYWAWQRRRVPLVMIVPFAAVAIWWLYLRLQIADGVVQDTRALAAPLQGFVGAFQRWITVPDSTVDMLMGLILLFASVAIAIRAVVRPTPLGLSVAGFAALALILSEPVWARYFDSSRALAPVLTAYVLLVPSRRTGDGARREAVAVS